MRPTISWADLAGRTVGIWGLGTEGRATLRKLRSLGIEPVIVDARGGDIGDEHVLAADRAGIDALRRCDVVLKAPGISRYDAEVEAVAAPGGPALTSGLAVWLQSVDRSRVLCITGTKGKSTATSIAAHLARGLGLRVFAGGNLGSLPYEPDAPDDVDLWVIETSSYQATDLASSPPVVAVTSLHPDHLPWHRGAENYFRDKLSLCTQPGARLTVASATSPLLVERRDLLGPEVRWISPDTWPSWWAEPLGLLGEHNLVNAGIARACLEAMGVAGADDDGALHDAAKGFEALASRLEPVGSVGGVPFVDDNLSTNVLSALAAVDAFPGTRIALIAGGFDRDIDYRPLADGLAERGAATRVFTVYTTGPAIQRAVESRAAPGVDAVACNDLVDAVNRAWAWAEPDGVVLLSPAAASFDAFDDYRHRGRVFRQAVAALADGPAGS